MSTLSPSLKNLRAGGQLSQTYFLFSLKRYFRHALTKTNLFKIIKTIRIVVSQCLAIEHLMRKLGKRSDGIHSR